MSAIRQVTFVSPADRTNTVRPLGWQATCPECGWEGLVWSIPGRNRERASRAMAHTDLEMHDREEHS